MQLPSPQFYLIKTKTNFAYYFYLTKERTIAYKTFTDQNVFLEEEVLVSTPVVDFSVSIDGNDYIHLVTITTDGDLTYYIQQNNQWNHRQMSKLDIKSNTYKNLVLILKNKVTHILCNKTNLTNPAITAIEHMYWNETSIKKVTVTTYLPGKYSSPFQVDVDSMGNLHLVNKVLHTKNNQLYYRYFNIFNTKWSNGEIISNLQEDHSHPHILIDKDDNLHLVWCTILDNNFTLNYKRKLSVTNYKSKWSSNRNLSNSNSNNLSPILLQEGSIIKVFSRQNNRISEIFSEDFGTNWQLQDSKLHALTELTLFKFASNNSLERHTNSINQVFGEVSDSVSVVGADLFKKILKKEVPPINKTIDEPPSIGNETSEPLGVLKNDLGTSSSQKIKTELTREIKIDQNLKELVQEVQDYLNRMVVEVEKIEETKKNLDTVPLNAVEDFSKSPTFQQFQNTLQHLNEDLSSIENEQFILQKELDDFQKKIYSIEDRMIQFKKQLLELEDKVMKIPSMQSSFVSRLKSIFK